MGEFLSLTEAARYAGLTRPTLNARIRTRRIPVFPDPGDERVKLVRVADVEPLRRRRPLRPRQAGTPDMAGVRDGRP